MDTFKISRTRMVREQLAKRGISDPYVLEAMGKVPRHLFVAEAFWAKAYEDHPLPIDYGQTISQPYIVALMSQWLAIQPGMRILEIGTGSGYQSVVLDEIGNLMCKAANLSNCIDIYTVERVKELYARTSNFFIQHRHRGIRLKLADGTEGWPEAGPFDRIIVTAGGPIVPVPLVAQLKDPGLMVIPVGESRKEQRLVRVWKKNGEITQEDGDKVAFVDLVGSHGW